MHELILNQVKVHVLHTAQDKTQEPRLVEESPKNIRIIVLEAEASLVSITVIQLV